ncbi:hypothetical protein Tco_0630788, partial [Tanacetum coccineum]
MSWKGIEDAKYDLYRYGFVPNYYVWDKHGEQPSQRINREMPNRAKAVNLARNMVIDAAGSQFEDLIFEAPTPPEPPNPAAKRFFDLLSKADAPLYKGCEGHSTLSATSRMLNIKSDFNMSQTCYDRVMQAIKEFIPRSTMCSNYYESKKMVSQLGLGYLKIDCCPNGCMLYYGKKNEGLDKCYRCDHARYKPKEQGSLNGKDISYKYMHYLPLIPRLQRLYMSKETAQHMTWHHEHKREPGVLSHPSDGEAWKKFDQIHAPFAAEPRNVRLGLCTDGFTPFGMSSTSYSCWPVIVTPYNLPPWLCMKIPYMFLTLIIPGPHSPKKNIDVFLQPLIDELYVLWKDGVDTYDAFRERNFNLKAALMWTINDFPAYGMLSGWSTHGRLSCPYCMEKSKAFHLKHGRKTSFFYCHRQFLPMNHPFRRNKDSFTKGRVENDTPPPRLSGLETWRRVHKYPKVTNERYPTDKNLPGFGVCHNWTKKSIFWDLPYWKTNLIRHNLDVMHVEKNVFDNIFNTVMDDKDKTKDNVKARQDVKEYCKRHELELVMEANGNTLKPKALYTLNKEQKKVVLQWVKNLKFPDGYASNLSRCVDLQRCKMWGMKSHDCHVFMERLLPIAFREMLPEPIWKAMTEILPPGFFDHMEHLLVHLSYEARVGGPEQYRWMYPFERKFEAELKVKMPNMTSVQLIRATEERFGRWIRDYVLNPLNSNLVNDNLKSLAIGPSRHARTWQLYYVNGFNFHTMHHSFGRKTSNTDLCIVGEGGDYYGQLNDVIELEYMNCSK